LPLLQVPALLPLCQLPLPLLKLLNHLLQLLKLLIPLKLFRLFHQHVDS
jgi:hypothetical protein